MNMNFNTDPVLFANLRQSILAEDKPLRTSMLVIDGHILWKGDVIARFTTTADAQQCLLESGFQAIHEHGEIRYHASTLSTPDAQQTKAGNQE